MYMYLAAMWLHIAVLCVIVYALPVVKDTESENLVKAMPNPNLTLEHEMLDYLGQDSVNYNMKNGQHEDFKRKAKGTRIMREANEGLAVDTPIVEVGLDINRGIIEPDLPLEEVYIKKGGVCTLLQEYKQNPLYVISRCPLTTPNSNIKTLCEVHVYSRHHQEENGVIDLVLTPVQDEAGLVYRNIYCAQCHHVVSPVFWQTHMNCSTPIALSVSDGNERLVVAEDFFAQNQVCAKKLRPALQHNLHECHQRDTVSENGGKLHNIRIGSSGKNGNTSPFPLSFSLLMNFGFDGKTNILLSTASKETVTASCGLNEIYDSDNDKCRVVSCNHGYQLNDGVCTKVSHFESDDVSDLMYMEDSAQVTLSLNISTEELIAIWFIQDIEQLFVNSISNILGIGTQRIVNLTVSVVNASDPENKDMSFIDVYLLPRPTLPSKMHHKVQASVVNAGQATVGELSNDDGDVMEALQGSSRAMNVDSVNITDPETVAKGIAKSGSDNSSLNSDGSSSSEEVETYLESYYILKLSFLLLPAHRNRTMEEKSVKNLVKDMTDLIYTNSFMFTLNGTELQVHSMQNDGSVDSMEEFCMRGWRRFVSGNEFAYAGVFNSPGGYNDSVIVLNETGQTFGPGEYDLTIAVEGTVGNLSRAKVNTFAFICTVPKLENKQCGRITLTEDEYTDLKNATILFADTVYTYQDFEYVNEFNMSDHTVRICTPNWSSIAQASESRWTLVCGDDLMKLVIAESYLTFGLGLISLVAMLTVLVTYGIFEKLRNLPGINTMNLTVSLFLGELVFIISGTVKPQEDWQCSGVGMLLHYLFLASFFWMNVMSFDVYRTFANSCILTRIRNKRKYMPRYSAYAWGCPLLIVAVCAVVDFTDLVPSVRVGYGGNTGKTSGAHSINTRDAEVSNNTVGQSQSHVYSIGCWIQEPVASMVAFGGPMMFILLGNCVMFIRTIICIRASTKLVKVSVRRSSLSHMTGHHDVMLYIRMSTVMGFTWIFGLASSFISAFVGPPSWTICIVLHLFSILFVVFNCSQGIFIFFAFVFNRRVLTLYKTLYQRLRNRREECSLVLSSSRATLSTRISQLSVNPEK